MSDADLHQLYEEMTAAKTEMEEARRLVESAQRDETMATNRFNEVARKIDAEIERLRSEAPAGTDWHREDRVERARSVG